MSQLQNDDRCLDIGEKVRVSDDEVRAVLSRQSVSNINQLLKLEKQKRDEIIRSLKSMEDVTVRQLSRITGISKSVIDKTRHTHALILLKFGVNPRIVQKRIGPQDAGELHSLWLL